MMSTSPMKNMIGDDDEYFISSGIQCISEHWLDIFNICTGRSACGSIDLGDFYSAINPNLHVEQTLCRDNDCYDSKIVSIDDLAGDDNICNLLPYDSQQSFDAGTPTLCEFNRASFEKHTRTRRTAKYFIGHNMCDASGRQRKTEEYENKHTQ